MSKLYLVTMDQPRDPSKDCAVRASSPSSAAAEALRRWRACGVTENPEKLLEGVLVAEIAALHRVSAAEVL